MDQRSHLFLEVARHKSFSRASKSLFMTPQGLSKSIHSLEAEYNCSFFRRTADGLELTESGKIYFEYARNVAMLHKGLKRDLERIRQTQEGVVDLLSGYGIIRLLTPECIDAFKKTYSDVEFHYREFPDQKVVQYFRNGEGNVALTVGHFEGYEYDVLNLWSFPMRLLVHKDHPLSQRKSVTIDALKGERLYIESPDFAAYHIIVDKCRQNGFDPDIAFETSGFSLCHKLVAQNKGISVTMDFMLQDMHSDTLRSVPFSDGDYSWNIQMLTRKNEKVGKGVTVFSKFIQDWMELINAGKILR